MILPQPFYLNANVYIRAAPAFSDWPMLRPAVAARLFCKPAPDGVEFCFARLAFQTGSPAGKREIMSESLHIVIVGGGTAGWMTATALANVVGSPACRVTLVESEEIGSVGVGEATLPQMKDFNDYVGILETEMMRSTQASFKLGIEFCDWGFEGSSYIHPFGTFGRRKSGTDFLQQWVRAKRDGGVQDIESFSYAIQACREARFDFPVEDEREINSSYAYAYHFDAGLYARFLRGLCEPRGVKRVEGRIVDVQRDGESGHVTSVRLQSGQEIAGDYFIDCSGFHSLLFDKTLGVPFEDWSKWLVCDRAVAVPCARTEPMIPYTRSTAKAAGWQWRIPLQHRTGNGYVYCSDYISDDEAAGSLLADLDGEALDSPRMLRFRAGRRRHSWQGNCIAIGLSSGFLEPLESTSIYLIQVAILALTRLFPRKQPDPALVEEFNRLVDYEYDRVRDFLILHYHLNSRDDSELWRYCREMTVPDSLTEKMDQFRHRGYVGTYRYGLFAPPSWISVFLGQGLEPAGYAPYADNMALSEARSDMDKLAVEIEHRVQRMPMHGDFLADHCPADTGA
jgi:tryptophan halogenase